MPSSEIGTLDTIHLLPPVYVRSNLDNTSNVRDHHLYLSTPETTAFDVYISNADGSINQTVSVSNASPQLVTLSAAPYGGTGTSSLGILSESELNTATSTQGLVITSSSTNRFYANLRHESGAQGAFLTTKGQTGMGTRFRTGHLYSNDQQTANKAHFISVMATEDNTVINFSDIDNGISFVGLAGNPGPYTLEQYQTVTVAVHLDALASGDINDLNGTLVTSDKPIVVHTGSINGGGDSGGGRDWGIDQAMPTGYAGTSFILSEGGGSGNASQVERPIIIADVDGTEIYINGATTAVATINAGDYYAVDGDTYFSAGGTMYIRTSEPVLVYQSTSANSGSGPGMSFVPAIQSNLEPQDIVIPNIDQLGTPTISIVALASSTVNINGVALGGAQSVGGISDYVLYTDTGRTGNISVTGTEPFFAGVTSVSGNLGAAGYFVGFANSYAVRDETTVRPSSSTTVNVQTNDISGQHNFSVTALCDEPTIGSAVLNGDGTITYTMSSSTFVGSETFGYTISNGSGITDVSYLTVSVDTDGDGIGDSVDIDIDGDGIPNTTEGAADGDGDSISNQYDLDSDGDGIYDAVEAGHGSAHANGVLTAFAGANGLADSLETVAESGTINYTLQNSDLSGDPDYLDLESDGDGFSDEDENNFGSDPTNPASPGAVVVPSVVSISNDTGTSSSDQITNDRTLLFSGTSTASSTINIFIDNVSVGTTSADGSGNWSYDHTAVTLSEGVHNISASTTDFFGRSSGTSSFLMVTIDVTAPGIPTVDSPTAITYGVSTITASGTGATAGETITAWSDAGGSCQTVVDGSGNWACDISGLGEGHQIISVTTTDIAGNTSASTNINITVDAVPNATTTTNSSSGPKIKTLNPETVNEDNFVALKGKIKKKDDWIVYFVLSETQSNPICSVDGDDETWPYHLGGRYNSGDEVFVEIGSLKEGAIYYYRVCGNYSDGTSSTKQGSVMSFKLAEDGISVSSEDLLDSDLELAGSNVESDSDVVYTTTTEQSDIDIQNLSLEFEDIINNGSDQEKQEFFEKMSQQFGIDSESLLEIDDPEIFSLLVEIQLQDRETFPVEDSSSGLVTEQSANESVTLDIESVITEDISAGVNNNPSQVDQLIAFLNEYEQAGLAQDGSYDADDQEAVKNFQNKYKREVLSIWGLDQATGFVGPTTRLKMDIIANGISAQSCPAFTQYNSLTENTRGIDVLPTERLLQSLDLFDETPNSVWDGATHQAMIRFQETFSATMLAPWGLNQGTGYKFKTTNKFMNELVGCTTQAVDLGNGVVFDYFQ